MGGRKYCGEAGEKRNEKKGKGLMRKKRENKGTGRAIEEGKWRRGQRGVKVDAGKGRKKGEE